MPHSFKLDLCVETCTCTPERWRIERQVCRWQGASCKLPSASLQALLKASCFLSWRANLPLEAKVVMKGMRAVPQTMRMPALRCYSACIPPQRYLIGQNFQMIVSLRHEPTLMIRCAYLQVSQASMLLLEVAAHKPVVLVH